MRAEALDIKVRVRGIYATAISKILRDERYTLVDVSDVLVERLQVPLNRGLPADVTVKTDNDDASKLLIIGHSEYAEAVAKTLLEHIPAVITYIPPVGLYATLIALVKGVKEGCCIIETPYGQAELVEYRECKEGALLPVSIIKVPTHPGDRIVAVPGVRIVGDFAVVWRGSKVLFSPHLKNRTRVSELLSISSQYVRKGISIKWRSNADEADLGVITTELPQLVSQLEVVEERTNNLKEVSIITKGERLILMYLTYDAKMYLDSVRRSITPTADYHHLIKTSKGLYRDVAEILDEVSVYIDSTVLRKITRKFMAKTIEDIGELTISHKKLNGTNIRLGTANLLEFSNGDGFELVLERKVRGSGVYDGIKVKKDFGDIIKTVVTEGIPYLVHYYYGSGGRLKGVYVNINTKPELVIPNTVEYVDLAIDLVRAKNEPCELVDQEELRSHLTSQFMAVSQEVYEYVVRGLSKALDEYCS
ncbi:MAG: DUF402 domain-containing protein [Sulfolobales archaeon]